MCSLNKKRNTYFRCVWWFVFGPSFQCGSVCPSSFFNHLSDNERVCCIAFILLLRFCKSVF